MEDPSKRFKTLTKPWKKQFINDEKKDSKIG